jgi:hypothetical protein
MFSACANFIAAIIIAKSRNILSIEAKYPTATNPPYLRSTPHPY